MARGGGIENDVIIFAVRAAVGEQIGELVEGSDLRGAGTREALGDAGHFTLGQESADGRDDPFTVGLDCLLRVNFQGGEARHVLNGSHGVADGHAEDLPDIGRGVGADQQHLLAGLCQGQGGRAGHRGLANAALACEENEPWSVLEEFHAASISILVDTQQGAPVIFRRPPGRLPGALSPDGKVSPMRGSSSPHTPGKQHPCTSLPKTGNHT